MSVGLCAVCHRQMCVDCMSTRMVAMTCQGCAGQHAAAAARRRRVGLLALIPLFGAMAWVGNQALAWLSPEAVAARAAAQRLAVARAEADAEVAQLTAGLRQTPCNRKQLITVLEALLRANLADAVLTEVQTFEQACGAWPRAWWSLYAAREQRGEFIEAAEVATKLIKDAPDDHDFWWWRGRAYEHAGAFDKAEADYRQVREMCPQCLVGWSTADVLEKLGRPCDAIAPLVQSLVMHADLRNADEVRARVDRLSALPACQQSLGRGALKLPLVGGHAVTRGAINGNNVELLVDTGATSVAVSRAMAARMHLDALPGMRVRTQTANGEVEGLQVIADEVRVGPLVATAVPVMILPDLSGPALLGMSFLGRFDLKLSDRTLEISSRARAAAQTP